MKDLKILEFPQYVVEQPFVEILTMEFNYDPTTETVDAQMSREIDGFSQPSVEILKEHIELNPHKGEDISKEIANYLYENVDYLNEANGAINSNISIKNIIDNSDNLTDDDAIKRKIKNKITSSIYFCATENRFGHTNVCIANAQTIEDYKDIIPDNVDIVINKHIKNNDIFFTLHKDSMEVPCIKFINSIDPNTKQLYYRIYKNGNTKFTTFKLTIG